ncbi:MAG: secondary thiamine-phosphate synthase enzyme YjbQ [Vicinamibacterales bacterium]
METLTAAPLCHCTTLVVETDQPHAFVDLTDRVSRLLLESGIHAGTVTIQSCHTTTGVVINEHEPLLLVDFHRLLDRLAPRGSVYHHDDMTRRTGISDHEPQNGHAHCRALLLPSSVTLVVHEGRLALGRWQRLFLVEFDGPRTREVAVAVVGRGAGR